MTTLYEHAGGEPALHRFVDVFYSSVLADPVLQPLFGAGKPEHVPALTAVLGEVFGGPATFTERYGGFAGLLAPHLGLRITEEQRQRFVELFVAAADAGGLPDDEPFRRALRSYVEFGTEVARQNSHAATPADYHDCQEIPRWSWDD